MIYGHRKRRKNQVKTESVFNKIIAENSPNHEKVIIIYVQQDFRTSNRQD
jgi:hypothetical protein